MVPLAVRAARGRTVAFQVPERAGRLRVVSPAFVAQVHRDGARVEVWVVDEPEDITRLFDWGVDGVISDRPDLAVADAGSSGTMRSRLMRTSVMRGHRIRVI